MATDASALERIQTPSDSGSTDYTARRAAYRSSTDLDSGNHGSGFPSWIYRWLKFQRWCAKKGQSSAPSHQVEALTRDSPQAYPNRCVSERRGPTVQTVEDSPLQIIKKIADVSVVVQRQIPGMQTIQKTLRIPRCGTVKRSDKGSSAITQSQLPNIQEIQDPWAITSAVWSRPIYMRRSSKKKKNSRDPSL